MAKRLETSRRALIVAGLSAGFCSFGPFGGHGLNAAPRRVAQAPASSKKDGPNKDSAARSPVAEQSAQSNPSTATRSSAVPPAESWALAQFAANGAEAKDLISQSLAKAVLAGYAKLGGQIEGAEALLSRVLPDGDFLVQQFASPAGKSFFRACARYSQGYDRLDRLRSLPRGEARIRELIRGPDGYKLIEYMATSKGGQNLGKQLARDHGGANFNQPTDRLYTPQDFARAMSAATKSGVGPNTTSPGSRATNASTPANTPATIHPAQIKPVERPATLSPKPTPPAQSRPGTLSPR